MSNLLACIRLESNRSFTKVISLSLWPHWSFITKTTHIKSRAIFMRPAFIAQASNTMCTSKAYNSRHSARKQCTLKWTIINSRWMSDDWLPTRLSWSTIVSWETESTSTYSPKYDLLTPHCIHKCTCTWPEVLCWTKWWRGKYITASQVIVLDQYGPYTLWFLQKL